MSFIVPAFNCAAYLEEAVESIIDRNLEPGDEVVVVDDCSTDETPRVVTALRAQHEAVRTLRHRENRGTAAASRNTGISAARHDLLFCLDSDNVLVPGSITGLVDHMLSAGADAAAFGELHYFVSNISKVSHKWVFRAEITLADAFAGVVWPGPSGNYLFTRHSWLTAGRYYEPTLENRSLDSWTFALRQLGTGSRMVTLPGTWYYHRYGHESHYVKNKDRGNQSLSALSAILPLLDLLEPKEIDYLFSREARYSWVENLAERPIRVKAFGVGRNGTIQSRPRRTRPVWPQELVSLARAVRRWLGLPFG